MIDSTATYKSIPHLLHKRMEVIDGFRGLAVLLVIAYHYLPFFSFGWIGVDLFFVISGFLITGKLIESLGTANYFSSFYLNRILRIVPLYYLVLVVFFFFLPWLLPAFVSGSVNQLLSQQVYYWTFTVNFYNALYGWSPNVMLVPMWSLACEMQFYLIWPFVVLIIYKIDKRYFTHILILFIFLTVLYRLSGNYKGQLSAAYTYVLLPSRLDSFCIGALLYVIFNDNNFVQLLRKGWMCSFVAVLLALCIMYYQGQAWHLDAATTSKFGYTLDALFWAGIIAFVKSPGSRFFTKIFTSKWLVQAGKYSYGMYILHVPVKVILLKLSGNTGLATSNYYLTMLISFVFTIACSFASYHLIEKTFLQYKRGLSLN